MHRYLCIVLLVFTIASCNKKGKDERKYVSPAETQENMIKANRVLVKKDRQRIAGTVERNGWDMAETETGMWFEVLSEGSGDSIVEGNKVSLNYTLSLLDGRECYSSDESGPKIFTVGRGGVESGLEQGILLCKANSKVRLILPPHLAHGLTGDGERIPARAILIYEIEVINLSK